jgi:Mg2+ and Co2+ transporter CorA
MSEHYEKHAVEVSNGLFRSARRRRQRPYFGAHRNELAMLIEAAISTAVFEAVEEAADEVAALSERLRHDAEHYDKAASNV